MQHTKTEYRKPPVNGREQHMDRETRPRPTGVASHAIGDGAHHSNRVPEQPVDRVLTPRTHPHQPPIPNPKRFSERNVHPPPNPTHPNSDNTPYALRLHKTPVSQSFPNDKTVLSNLYLLFITNVLYS